MFRTPEEVCRALHDCSDHCHHPNHSFLPGHVIVSDDGEQQLDYVTVSEGWTYWTIVLIAWN